MKKVILLGVSVALSFAMSAPSADYIDSLLGFLNGKSFTPNGLFYMYDFNKNGKIERNDWVYITNDVNHIPFRLMGKTPTDKDPFGWQRLSTIPAGLHIDNPNGYFILIQFPKDKQLFGSYAFSWLYVTKDSLASYKLMGAKPDHSFDYLDVDGNGYPDPLPHINATYDSASGQITFIAHQSSTSSSSSQNSSTSFSSSTSQSSTSQSGGVSGKKQTCSDEMSTSFGGKNFYMKTSSWYQGNIQYNCKQDASYKWSLAVDAITIDNITKTERSSLRYNNHHLQGNATYNYAAGSVHIVGSYDGRAFNCYEYYKKIVPLTIRKDEYEHLEEVLEDWGSGGPCDPDFLSTTCPDWFYNDLQECTASGQEQSDPLDLLDAQSYELSAITDYTVNEDSGKVDRIHTEEIYKKQ